MTLEPCRDIHQQRKTGRVGFRKAVLSKAENLLINALCKIFAVAALAHPLGKSFFIMTESAVALPGGHRATQSVGFTGCKAGRYHCEFDYLLLKDRNAQRAVKHLAHCLAGVGNRFFAVSPSEVGVHHIALNRPGTNYCNLNHQIIKTARPQPGQHHHLCA